MDKRTLLSRLQFLIAAFLIFSLALCPIAAYAAPDSASESASDNAVTDTAETTEENLSLLDKIEDIYLTVKEIGDKLSALAENIKSGKIVDMVISGLAKGTAEVTTDLAMELFRIILEISNTAETVFNTPTGKMLVDFFRVAGWVLWSIGIFYALAELGIVYKVGSPIEDALKTTGLNLFKSYIAVLLFTKIPLPLFVFSISLQEKVLDAIVGISAFENYVNNVNNANINVVNPVHWILMIIAFIAACYAGCKVMFNTLKRGGILLMLIGIGTLHMFSLPRGYWDGFISWCKQVIGLCLAAFIELVIFVLGISVLISSTITIPSVFAATGVMLAAPEVNKIADRFSIDSSIRGNASSAIATVASVVKVAAMI